MIVDRDTHTTHTNTHTHTHTLMDNRLKDKEINGLTDKQMDRKKDSY